MRTVVLLLALVVVAAVTAAKSAAPVDSPDTPRVGAVDESRTVDVVPAAVTAKPDAAPDVAAEPPAAEPEAVAEAVPDATSPPAEEDATPSVPLRVRLVDAETGAPLEGGAVRLGPRASDWRMTRAGGAFDLGVTPLRPGRADVELDVEPPPGYAPERVALAGDDLALDVAD